MCVCAGESRVQGSQKRTSDSLELEFQEVMSHAWVLGIELGSSTRIVCSRNCQTIVSLLKCSLLKSCFIY